MSEAEQATVLIGEILLHLAAQLRPLGITHPYDEKLKQLERCLAELKGGSR